MDKEKRVEKLISLFESLGKRNRKPVKPDQVRGEDPAWNQTEEAYQEEQRRWLEEVRKKKVGK